MQGVLVDAQPVRRERPGDQRDEAADGDLRHAAGVRAPADGDDEQQPGDRIVLEHHLPAPRRLTSTKRRIADEAHSVSQRSSKPFTFASRKTRSLPVVVSRGAVAAQRQK